MKTSGTLAAELIYAANEAGVPNEDIFVDGIVTPVNIQQGQLMSLLAFQEMLATCSPASSPRAASLTSPMGRRII